MCVHLARGRRAVDPVRPVTALLCCTRSTPRSSLAWRMRPTVGSRRHWAGRPKLGKKLGTLSRIRPVLTGQSRTRHDRDQGHLRRSNDLVRVAGQGVTPVRFERTLDGFESAARCRTGRSPAVTSARCPNSRVRGRRCSSSCPAPCPRFVTRHR